jgi:hypothetical protein
MTPQRNILDELADLHDTSAQASLQASWQVNPEQRARSERLARELGVTPHVIEQQPDLAGREAKVREAAKVLPAAPKTRAWLADPGNAAVAHDQLTPLSLLEGVVGRLFRQEQQKADVARSVPAGGVKAIAGGIGGAGEGLWTGLNIFERWRGPTPWAPPARAERGGSVETAWSAIRNLTSVRANRNLSTALTSTGEAGERLGEIIGAPKTRQNIATAIGEGVGQAGANIALSLVAPAATLPMLAGQGAEQIADRAEEAGVRNTPEGDAAVLAGAAITAATEKVGLDLLLRRLPPAISNQLMRDITDLAVAGAGEASQEAVEGLAQNLVERALLDPDAPVLEGLEKDAAVGGAVGVITRALVNAVVPGRQRADRKQAVAQGRAGAAALTEAVEAVRQSPLAERSPERFQALLAAMADEDEVFLPAESLRTYMQSLAPAEQQQFLDATEIGPQLEAALVTGGDVAIPAANYLARIAPTPAHEALAKDVRLGLGGVSLSEAEAFEAEQGDVIEREGERLIGEARAQEEAAAPGQRVYDETFSQFRSAGYGVDAASRYATLWRERYQTRGARLGIDAYEAMQRGGGVQVRQTLPEAVSRRLDRVDLMIDTLRARRTTPEKRGPSLIEFVSRQGGIKNDGGELSALGLDRWHVGKPGRGKLAKDTGRALEEMAQLAQDAGYFDDVVGVGQEQDRYTQGDVDAYGRVSVERLLAAMDDELRGNARYAAPADESRSNFATGVEQLEELLSVLGVDERTATNEEIKAALEAFRQGEGQTFAQQARGDITFPSQGYGSGATLIRLFQGKDLSTLLHEGGHLWLEELAFDAADPNAPDQLRADFDAVRGWLGNTGEPFTVEQHEQFARGVEAYLMEGKAPSNALRSAFRAFKVWLTRIYRSLQRLDVQVSPEMREVFDRLVATEDQIAEAKEAQRLTPALPDAVTAGMTDEAFAAYARAVSEADQAATDRLTRKVMRDVTRRRTEEWRRLREPVREEVAEELANVPEHRAMEMLRTRQFVFSKREVVGVMGTEEVLKRLPRGVPPFVLESGGLHPDLLAEMVGMPGGGQGLLEALMTLEDEKRVLRESGDKRTAIDARIDAETDRRMNDRHGDMLTDGSLEEEALLEVNDLRRSEVLATELRAFVRKAGEGTGAWSQDQMRSWAERQIASRRVRDLRPDLYARAERKAGDDALKALVTNDWSKAADAKFRQLLNLHLYRAARLANERTEQAFRRMSRLDRAKTIPTMDQAYLDQIHALLEGVDFRRVTNREAGRRQSLQDFLASREESGLETPYIAPSLLEAAALKPWREMTVTELQALDDSIKSLAHLGRLKRKLLDAKAEREFEAVVSEALQRAEALPEKASTEYIGAPTWGERLIKTAKGFEADHVKAQTWFDILDGGDPEGVFSRVLDAPGVEAANRKGKLYRDFVTPIAEAAKAIPSEITKRDLDEVDHRLLLVPGTQRFAKLRRRDLRMLAVHLGSDSNFEKVARGYGLVSRDAAQPVLDAARERVLAYLNANLHQTEWAYVQAWWDAFARQQQEYFANERLLTGVTPEAVELREVETPDGVLRGGYAPISYNRDLDRAGRKSADAEAADFWGGHFTQARTDNGNAKARTAYVGAVDLSPERMFSTANKMMTRLAYGRYVLSANTFLHDPRIENLIRGKLGDAAYDSLRPWLQRQVRDEIVSDPALGRLSRFLRGTRLNMQFAAMAFSATVMGSQPAGLAVSAAVIGERWLAHGIAKSGQLVGLKQFDSYVLERSEFMRQRRGELDRDMREGVRLGTSEGAGWYDRLRAAGFEGVGFVDMYMVAGPTWIGAFDKALSEGADEELAVRLADKAVRETQGSGRPIDLAPVQGGSEVSKLFTFAYGWANVQHQRLRHQAVGLARGRMSRREAFRQSMWILLAGPLAASVLSLDFPEVGDDEEPWEAWTQWALGKIIANPFQGIIGVREIASGMERRASGKFAGEPLQGFLPRMVSAPTTLINDAVRLATGEEVSGKWPKHLIEAVGYPIGFPGTAQAARTTQYIVEVNEGEQEPDSFWEFAHGIIRGPQDSQR